MKARAEETIRGTLWRWPHSEAPYYGLRAADYEVREVGEKKAVVILCQDGVWGWKDDGRRKKENKKQAEDEIEKLAGSLLQRRWKEVRLMDLILESREFEEGDFKGAVEAGFKRADAEVVKLVETLPKQVGDYVVDWSEPIMWQAQFNTVAVIITPEEVFTAGSGSFAVRLMSNNQLAYISSKANLSVTNIKGELAAGVPKAADETSLAFQLRALDVKNASKSTLDATFKKYKLKEGDKCIVVEQWSPHGMNGKLLWHQPGKDWGAILTSIEEDVWPGHHYEAILLQLKPCVDELGASTPVGKVPTAAPALCTPTKMAAEYSPRRMLSVSPLKKRFKSIPSLVTAS